MPFHVLSEELSPSDREVLALHDDVPEYQERLKKAGADVLHAAFAKYAGPFILPGDCIADVGVGDGAVAKILVKRGHFARRVGNDISKPYLADVFNRRLYDDCWLGTADQFVAEMIQREQKFDWVTLVSVTYYFSPERLRQTLAGLTKVCRKGVILTLDGIPEALRERWRNDVDRPVTVYDHRDQTQRLLECGFTSAEQVWSGIGWASSLTGLEVPVDLYILRR